MPRRRPVERETAVIPSNSLVASGMRYPGKAARIYYPKQDWQAECYRHYRICGEARFAAKFFGHALARATLHAAKSGPDGAERQTSGPAFEYLESLFNGRDGQEQMLEAIGIHFTIAGECFLVGRKVEAAPGIEAEELWEIVSVMEMVVNGNRWSVKYGDGRPEVNLTEDDVVIRLWMPDPAKRIEADSPFRSLLPILSEIEWLTRHVFAQVQSRLAGAGVWVLPQGITFPPPPGQNGQEVTYENEAQGAMMSLGGSMLAPIEDPSNPAALIPTIIQVPDEHVDKIKEPIHFWSPLDEEARSLRAEAIQRFAVGMELPPEQILGMSSNQGTGGGSSNGVSHWGAWQIEESTIKMFVEPMLSTVANSLVVGYIRPLTDDPTDVIIYDTTSLRLRPDRSKEAMELYDRGSLKEETMLTENGFEVGDMPDEAEFKRWLIRKIASGSATPEMVAIAAAYLGVDLPIGTGTTNEARPDPSLEDHPTKPRTPNESALVVACDALVYRAMERVGNRLRGKTTSAVAPGCPSFKTHVYIPGRGKEDMLLDDAWSCAAEILEGIADADVVVPVLDAYARTLIQSQAPHSRKGLEAWLELGQVA